MKNWKFNGFSRVPADTDFKLSKQASNSEQENTDASKEGQKLFYVFIYFIYFIHYMFYTLHILYFLKLTEYVSFKIYIH